MGEVPRQDEPMRRAPAPPECPDIDRLPYPDMEEHLQNDRELDQLLRQLRPAEMLVAFDAMLCLLHQLYMKLTLVKVQRGGSAFSCHTTADHLQTYQDVVGEVLNRIRLRFDQETARKVGGPEDGRITNPEGARFPPYSLQALFESEMEELAQAVREGQKIKTRAANYVHNHPSDTLRAAFPLIARLELDLPRHDGSRYTEEQMMGSQWRAVAWLLEELKRRLAYRWDKGMLVQGSAQQPILWPLEGRG